MNDPVVRIRIPGLVWEDKVRTLDIFPPYLGPEHPTSPVDIAPTHDLFQGLPTHVKSCKHPAGRKRLGTANMAGSMALFHHEGHQRLVVGFYEEARRIDADGTEVTVRIYHTVVEAIWSPDTLRAIQGGIDIEQMRRVCAAVADYDDLIETLDDGKTRLHQVVHSLDPIRGLAHHTLKMDRNQNRVQYTLSIESLSRRLSTEPRYRGKHEQPNFQVFRQGDVYHGLKLPWETTNRYHAFHRITPPGEPKRRKRRTLGEVADSIRSIIESPKLMPDDATRERIEADIAWLGTEPFIGREVDGSHWFGAPSRYWQHAAIASYLDPPPGEVAHDVEPTWPPERNGVDLVGMLRGLPKKIDADVLKTLGMKDYGSPGKTVRDYFRTLADEPDVASSPAIAARLLSPGERDGTFRIHPPRIQYLARRRDLEQAYVEAQMPHRERPDGFVRWYASPSPRGGPSPKAICASGGARHEALLSGLRRRASGIAALPEGMRLWRPEDDGRRIAPLAEWNGQSVMYPVKAKGDWFEFLVPTGKARRNRFEDGNCILRPEDGPETADFLLFASAYHGIGRPYVYKGQVNRMIANPTSEGMERIAATLATFPLFLYHEARRDGWRPPCP